jgi:hypothetical protein
MPEVSEATARGFQVVAGLSSLAIAVLALVMSIRSDRRAERVAAANERVAAAAVRPILVLERLGYDDHKAVRLLNNGPGVAVVKGIDIRRNGESFDRLADMFELGARWDRFFWIVPGQQYLPPGVEKSLVKLTFDGLVAQGKSESEATTLLEQWEKELAGATICITYVDVFDNEMPVCERTF